MRVLSFLQTCSKRTFALLCGFIVLFALLTRLYNLHFPGNFYFDEVYHGFTATTFLHNDPKGYEFWQTPPQGVAYEWTHPPLAKLFMAGGMKVFGEISIGWRLSSVLFGTGVVALTGVLAHLLFRNRAITLLTLSLVSLDNLLLTMSRLAMNDMHFLFFSLLSVIAYIQFTASLRHHTQVKLQLRWVLLCVIALGLALACKWTTMYVALGLGLHFIGSIVFGNLRPKLITLAISIVFALIAIPTLYVGSYTQFFLQGHTWKQFVETQQQMWWYHTGLKATHGYQSQPWQWIIDLRPVWMHVDYSRNTENVVANIYNTDNPLLLWVGLTAALTILLVLLAIWADFLPKKKTLTPDTQRSLTFVLIMYFMLWLPWTLSPRIMFFYHYSPAIPFLCIATAAGLVTLVKKKPRLSPLVWAILVGFILCFAILYPLNTGLFIPVSFINTLFSIFPTWR